jgi:TnpA family transposase
MNFSLPSGAKERVMKPTLFVNIESHEATNPIARALKAVAFGAEPVDQLVRGGIEADIAVTNSVKTALRMTKETEKTEIILIHLVKSEREEAIAFASRYLGRVTAVPIMRFGEDKMEIVPFLLKLIADKAREA